MRVVVSKLSESGQTVLPPEVLDSLGVKPGDTLRFLIGDKGVMLVPDEDVEEDPFAAFTEWASPEDAEAFMDL
jgi:antitoxin PrlF